MGLFSKLAITFKQNKKSNTYLPEAVSPVTCTNESTTCATSPYKTIASFDLNIEKPKYDGAIPDATIKFYPLDQGKLLDKIKKTVYTFKS